MGVIARTAADYIAIITWIDLRVVNIQFSKYDPHTTTVAVHFRTRSQGLKLAYGPTFMEAVLEAMRLDK